MQLDARNITCPRPVVMTLEALAQLAPGETLEVLVNDETARGNLTRLAEDKGLSLEVVDRGDFVSMLLAPEGVVAVADAEAEGEALCEVPEVSPAIVAFGSATMGNGDDKLGAILAKGLIYALAHQDAVPSTALFYNGGAKLTVEGSECLEDIRELESRGCSVLTCGTCLDYYGIREQLAVGGVTNLYEIARIVSGQPGVMVI